MAHDASDFSLEDDGPVASGSGQVTVSELTWAMLDDQINNDEFHLLESMLLSDDRARQEYVHCVQLHTDLLAHFAKPDAAGAAGKPQVLGFLGQSVPPFDVQPSQK